MFDEDVAFCSGLATGGLTTGFSIGFLPIAAASGLAGAESEGGGKGGLGGAPGGTPGNRGAEPVGGFGILGAELVSGSEA